MSKSHLHFYILLIFYFLNIKVKAQNHFANAGFEVLNNCIEMH